MADRQRWTRRDWVTMAVSAGVVILIAAVIGGVIAVVGGGSSAHVVTLEPAAQAGADPFTASVALGSAVDFPGNVRAITATTRKTFPTDPGTHTLIATATAPGLYGGSGDIHVCDPQLVVTFLGQNPQKAAAWASVLGISPGDIAAYVGSLTPVILTSDTLVTNHGYRDGHATTLQSVLQAGTAVMVDATGTPRVKCNCGNPLTPPEQIAPTHIRGIAWPGYSPTQVTVVRAGPATTNITVINIITGDTYNQTVGSSGGGTGGGGGFVGTSIGDAGYQAKFSTSPDGTTWSVAAQLKQPLSGGLAWANGKWLALSLLGGTTSVLESTDLRKWNVLATVPAYLDDIAYGNGQWIAIGTEPDADIGHGVVYRSTDGRVWTRAAAIQRSPELNSVAYGNGTWIAVDNGHQGGDTSRTYRSTDGTHWTPQNDVGLARQGGSRIAYGSGQWVLGGLAVNQTDAPDGVVSLSTDGNTWTAVAGTPFAGDAITGVAYGNGEWLAIGRSGDVFSSPDAKTWTKRSNIHGGAFDLSFGGQSTAGSPRPSPESTTTASTTTAPPASSLTRIDWKNYTYLDQVCPTRGPVKFTNGVWIQPGTKGTIEECSMSLVAVDHADVTGDGVADAIVSLHGSTSGVLQGQSDWTTVFTANPSGPLNHGYISGPSFPPYSASAGITIWIRHPTALDPDCCPSEYEKDAYRYTSRTAKFTKTGTAYVPASALPKR